jgi:hypothetical protein
MGKILDLIGKKFGNLLIVYKAGHCGRGRNTRWKWRCSCGVEGESNAFYLTGGHKTHCGCQTARDQNAEHPLYQTWMDMKRRCLNPKRASYKNYGGRGIRVCQEWLDSFRAFADYLGPKPSPDHSIDRIDNNGHYEPGNVRWATASQQMQNTRVSGRAKRETRWGTILRACGYSSKELARHTGISVSAIDHWKKGLGDPSGAFRDRLMGFLSCPIVILDYPTSTIRLE